MSDKVDSKDAASGSKPNKQFPDFYEDMDDSSESKTDSQKKSSKSSDKYTSHKESLQESYKDVDVHSEGGGKEDSKGSKSRSRSPGKKAQNLQSFGPPVTSGMVPPSAGAANVTNIGGFMPPPPFPAGSIN